MKPPCASIVVCALLFMPFQAPGQEKPAPATIPDGKALLVRLKSTDAEYEAGFTVSGTRPGWPKVKWKLVLREGEMLYQEEVVEIAQSVALAATRPAPRVITQRGLPPKSHMTYRRTLYIGPRAQVEHNWVGPIKEIGVLPPWPDNAAGPATGTSLGVARPDAATYMLLIRRPLLCLGRGYSRHLTDITQISRQNDGLLKVTAVGLDMALRPGASWELLVDPNTTYMVRSALVTDRRNRTVSIASFGVKRHGSRYVPEKATCKGDFVSATLEIDAVSAEADVEFLDHARAAMNPPFLVRTDVEDRRVNPALHVPFAPGKPFPQGRSAPWNIGWDDPRPKRDP